jgi:hypothetical protein
MSAESILAIQRTIGLYGQLLDDLRMEEWCRLFTEDAVWTMPGVRLEGRGRIARGVRKMEPDTPGLVRHLAFTPVIELDGEDSARAWTDFLFLVRDNLSDPWKTLLAGRYCDTLVREDEIWRFKVRVCDYDPGNRPDIAFEPSPSV